MHGARAPQVKAAAQRRLGRERLEREGTTGPLGLLLEELELEARGKHPAETLLDIVRRCWAMVAVLGQMTGELDTDQLMVEDLINGGLRPHPVVETYGLWSDRAARASKLACDAGIAERQVQITEATGKMLAAVVRQIVIGLGHDLMDESVQGVVRPALQMVRTADDLAR